MISGNYGRSFAYAARALNLKGTVLMPETAPESRAVVIRALGCDVERTSVDKLMDGVRKVRGKLNNKRKWL